MEHHIDDIMWIEWNEQRVSSTLEALGRQKCSRRWEIKPKKIQRSATSVKY